MGFPTDVRARGYEKSFGIDPQWNDTGDALLDDNVVTAITPTDPPTSKAGRLVSCRLFSKNGNIHLRIWLDSILFTYNARESALRMFNSYGCTGQGSYMTLRRYETVDQKYILELAVPLDFGNSMAIELLNQSGAPQRCYVDFNWMQNYP